MNWKTCKLACLQRMFANEGQALTEDDGNRDYLQSMPAAANEGMQILSTVGHSIRRKIEITFAAEAPVSFQNGVLTLPAADQLYFITVSDYCPDFRAVLSGQVFELRDGNYGPTGDWDVEGEDILKLSGEAERTVTVWYAAKPEAITEQTPDTLELGLREDAAALLPLYMASQLYKDDDIGMSVQFRNEFEDGLSKLQSVDAADTAAAGEKIKNTSGWY